MCQSTAEAELFANNEPVKGAESLAMLLEIFGFDVKRQLRGDSKAGLAQLTGDVGSCRTQHLRWRSAKLREVLQDANGKWETIHQKGRDLASDGLTKPLQGPAFKHSVE